MEHELQSDLTRILKLAPSFMFATSIYYFDCPCPIPSTTTVVGNWFDKGQGTGGILQQKAHRLYRLECDRRSINDVLAALSCN